MTQSSAFARRIRNFARQLRRNTRGLAMIETAITMPTLLFTSFAGLEMANMMIVHTKISAIALSAADNASRIASGSNLAQPQVREVDVNDTFTGAQIQSGLLDLNQHGRIILSSLETNIQGGQWIHWQRCYGNLPVKSAYGAQGVGITGNGFDGMGDGGAEVKATPGNAVMFVEVSYTYQPFLLGSLLNGVNKIEYEAAFAVRDARDTSNIYNPSPAATVRSCPTS
ncbi:MAG: hypothetical protein ABL909_11645, partial [Sphingopyxis sp.]